MKKVYFGFAISDSMFENIGRIIRLSIASEWAKQFAREGAISCFNPSHKTTIDVMKEKFGINIEIPKTSPRVVLERGDEIVVMGIRGLPRLTDRHEYTKEEIAQATFTFSLYSTS